MSSDDQRVILVTGVLKGIGNTCAAFLAKRGHIVYGTFLHHESRVARADEFFRLLAMDPTTDDSIENAVSKILDDQGQIDVLICHASSTITSSVENTTSSEARHQMEVNFMGLARIIQSVLPAMRSRQSGMILVIGSLAGCVGVPFSAYHAAGEFALKGFVESLRMEVRTFGIKIALIEPGAIHADYKDQSTKASGHATDPYENLQSNVARSVLSRRQAESDPVIVARLVERLMFRKHLKIRYLVGPFRQRIWIRLKSLLPSRIYESLLLDYYGLRNL